MTVTVDIKTGTRTVFEYITKPITKTISESLSENKIKIKKKLIGEGKYNLVELVKGVEPRPADYKSAALAN